MLNRLRNLWRLSSIEIPQELIVQKLDLTNEKPKMAQIIKRSTPVEKFMEQTKDE